MPRLAFSPLITGCLALGLALVPAADAPAAVWGDVALGMNEPADVHRAPGETVGMFQLAMLNVDGGSIHVRITARLIRPGQGPAMLVFLNETYWLDYQDAETRTFDFTPPAYFPDGTYILLVTAKEIGSGTLLARSVSPVFLGAAESCDGVDNDGDGLVDESPDDDVDGWSTCGGPFRAIDCDDGDSEVRPGAWESCDGVDNDCDGSVDEGCASCSLTVPGGYLTLQAAIDGSGPGDVLCADPGTYDETLLFPGHDIQLIGLSGPHQTIVTGGWADSVVRIENGEGPDTMLAGFTVTHGSSSDGGGIYLYDTSPTLFDLVVEDNVASDMGGGLMLDYAEPTISNTVVSDNSSDNDGGGIHMRYATAMMTDVEISDNVAADQGGGICAVWSTLDISWGSFSGNEADSGGGIREQQTETTLYNVVFTANTANDDGGGLLSSYSSTDIDNCVFAGNAAGDGGGGLYLADYSYSGLSYVALSGNEATYGGGLWIGTAGPILWGVVATGNQATYGGGIYVGQSSSTPIYNSIFAANEAAGGGAIYNSYAGFPVLPTYTDFWDNWPDDCVAVTCTPGLDGNLAEDPEFLDVSGSDPLDWDLHLSATSALIDAGYDHVLYEDPDGSRLDMGMYCYGGPDDWDLDHDGYPEWWQPGPYDHASYPGYGWDCDDQDPSVYPGAGC